MRRILQRIREAFEDSMRQQITLLGFVFTITVVLVGVGAFVSGNNLLFLLLAALLSTLLISGFVSRLGLAGLELRIETPDHVVAKRPTLAKVAVRNKKFMTPSFSLTLTGAKGSGLQEEIYIAVVPARSAVSERMYLNFERRGIYKNKTFWFATRFPFGFTYRRAHVRLEEELLVYPSIDEQPGFEMLLANIAGELESNQRGRGSDFYHIRPYVPSENARHVDWRATAHTGELQIREYARDQDEIVTIFLDLDTGDYEWFERAVECAAFLVWRLNEKGARVRFLTQRWSADEASVYDILKYLALVEPAHGLNPAIAHDRTLQIALSTRPEVLVEAGWYRDRVVTPDMLIIPGPDAGSRRDEKTGAGANVDHDRRTS